MSDDGSSSLNRQLDDSGLRRDGPSHGDGDGAKKLPPEDHETSTDTGRGKKRRRGALAELPEKDQLAQALAMINQLQAKNDEKDQELAKKDQALAQALAKNDEKDQELAKKDQALAKINQALAEKDQAIAQALAKIDEKDQFGFKALWSAGEDRFRLMSQGTGYSHVNGSHHLAEAKTINFHLKDPVEGTIESITKQQSRLLLDFADEDGRVSSYTYQSEADICHVVHSAALDAILVVKRDGKREGTADDGKLTARKERSLFGCRPDIMVVRDENGVGLLAIEVKQPNPKKKLTEYERVLGQAYDQAKAMNAFGQGTGTVIITSFEESYLCSLNGDMSDMDSQPDHPHEDDEAKTNESNRESGVPLTMSPPLYIYPNTVSFEQHSDTSPTSSPAKSSSNRSSHAESSSTLSLPSKFFAEGVAKEDRKLYTTSVYRADELVKLIYNAIKLAKSKYKASTKKIFKLESGQRYVFPTALRVVAGGKEKYCWGKLKAVLGQQITSWELQSRAPRKAKEKSINSDNDKAYYIIGTLGHGSTSNVFQALTSEGEHVAIKVYVKKYDDLGKPIDETTFQNNAKKATKQESKRLVEFYPILQKRVKTCKIFGLHSIVMPFFEPVGKDNRKEALVDIARVLSEFGNLQYEEEDIRWRHFGYFGGENGSKHPILYDLADLVEVANAEDSVQAVIKVLKKRISTEPEKDDPVHVEED